MCVCVCVSTYPTFQQHVFELLHACFRGNDGSLTRCPKLRLHCWVLLRFLLPTQTHTGFNLQTVCVCVCVCACLCISLSECAYFCICKCVCLCLTCVCVCVNK